METITVTINTKTHAPTTAGCVCGWKPGVWGCTTFGDHVGCIVDDKLGQPHG